MEFLFRAIEARSGFLGVWALALLLSLILWAVPLDLFQRAFGPVPPPLAILLAGVAGFFLVGRVSHGRRPVPWGRLLAIAAVFLLPPVAIDLAIPFADDLNAPFPLALAFYPAAGFLAEVVFHLLPLAVMAIVLRQTELPVWAFVPAVLAEPVFQAAASGGFTAQGMLVAIHVTLFSGVQLWVFRRHGFVAMYVFRLFYYAFWHLLWGTLRLTLFF